ncbi:MAG: type II secretion system F family protein [Clostridiales bacterium]|jgi:type IV pilus assembly protein PilC|nr:type II secretion system F family protein [Clostridiales bacterium]HQA47247.1 type II secretion system F family protein [Bacillota bacterium]
MTVYEYRARNRMGELVTGTYESSDMSDVVHMLRNKGLYPVFIEECREKRSDTLMKVSFRKVTYKDIAVFCRQFATMINAGMPIPDILDVLGRQTENPRLKTGIESLYHGVQKGKSLSNAMGMERDIFPELLANMVEAGELSGTLDRVMDRMAGHYEKEYRIRQKAKNAFVYPSLVAVVAVLVVVFLVAVVLPAFASMFQQMGAVLPLFTRMLLGICFFVRKRWVLLVIGTAVLLPGIGWYAKTPAGREFFDVLSIRAPVIGNVNKKVITARFARTLGALVSSGLPLLQGLEVAGKVVGNTVVQKGLGKVGEEVRKGKGLAEPLKKVEAFPAMLSHMIRIGEDTGTLDFVLDKTADYYDDEVERTVNRMTTLLEPAIIIVMAIVVTFIVLSIVMPMLDIMTQANF